MVSVAAAINSMGSIHLVFVGSTYLPSTLVGSRCRAMKVLSPKCSRSLRSMLDACSWAWYSVVSPGSLTCIDMAMLLPMRRVRRWCMLLTHGSLPTMLSISSSMSCGRLFSISSSVDCLRSFSAAPMMKKLTMMAAMESSTAQLLPRSMAPPTPRNVPTDDSESERWCQAFATTACEPTRLPTATVNLYAHSLSSMLAMAAAKATQPGVRRALPITARHVS